MNLDELKTKHPDLVEQLTNEVKTALNTEFDKERAKFTAEKSALETKLEDSNTRLANLEKKDAVREEREREATADRIWESKLSASSVDNHMFDKVKRMVSYKKFVKDDVLDVEAFSAAVDGEIKDWESRLANQSVSGFGSVERKTDGDNTTPSAQKSEENKKLSNDLLSRAGQQAS